MANRKRRVGRGNGDDDDVDYDTQLIFEQERELERHAKELDRYKKEKQREKNKKTIIQNAIKKLRDINNAENREDKKGYPNDYVEQQIRGQFNNLRTGVFDDLQKKLPPYGYNFRYYKPSAEQLAIYEPQNKKNARIFISILDSFFPQELKYDLLPEIYEKYLNEDFDDVNPDL